MTKTKQNKTLHKAIKCTVPATKYKIQQLQELRYALQQTLVQTAHLTDQMLVKNECSRIPTYLPQKLDINVNISVRYKQTMYAQTKEILMSYYEILANKLRKIIFNSNLSKKEQITLYRINKYHLWYSRSLSFYWLNGDIPCTSKTKGAIAEPVSDELLKLARKLIKQARKWCKFPNLSKIKTFKLTANVAKLETSNNSFEYWLRLSTLHKGKPILLPIKRNTWLDRQIAKGKLLNFVQLTINKNDVVISPIVEQLTVPLRQKGIKVGIDWGMKQTFVTSKGQFFGSNFLNKLKNYDNVLTEYSANLQREGKSLKQDTYYCNLQKRISAFVKNEINRMLNKIASKDLQTIAVERLNFAGSGLTKRLNRLLTRCGRQAVRAKLARLQEEQGINIEEINPAFTSQRCHNCGYINKNNRKTQKDFKCLSCGRHLNADLNAAFNIRDYRVISLAMKMLKLRQDGTQKTYYLNLQYLWQKQMTLCPYWN